MYKILDYKEDETTNSELSKGGKFYLSINKEDAQNLTIQLAVNYEATNMNLIDSEIDNDQQLAVEVQKGVKNESEELEVKEFDLSLRKYITQIGDTVVNDRNPKIDENALKTGTTAEYKHKKNAIQVQTGSEVIYNITVYNEGAQAGKATQITDQLPTGLEFVEVLTDNYEVEEYDKTTNRLVLKGKNLRNLTEYSGEGLDSETVRIKCKVTAEADTSKDKVLTNVAWISEAISEAGITVDRDSEPETTPQVNKDNMENYTGNESNKDVDLSQEEYYFKGEQDEDDFEKLVIIKQEPEPTPEPTPDPTPEPTPEQTPDPTPEPTPEPTQTPSTEQKTDDVKVEQQTAKPNVDTVAPNVIPQTGVGQSMIIIIMVLVSIVFGYKLYKDRDIK